MLSKLCHRIAYFFVQKNVVPLENMEIYRYGFEQILSSLYTIASILVISVLFSQFVSGVVFLLCFIPIRRFAGGYHAGSYFKCYLEFMLIYLSAELVLKTNVVEQNVVPSFVAMGISTIVIMLLSPVENENRPLSEEEQVRYKRLSIFMIMIEAATAAVLFAAGIAIYSTVLVTIVWVAVLQVFALSVKRLTRCQSKTLNKYYNPERGTE